MKPLKTALLLTVFAIICLGVSIPTSLYLGEHPLWGTLYVVFIIVPVVVFANFLILTYLLFKLERESLIKEKKALWVLTVTNILFALLVVGTFYFLRTSIVLPMV